MGQFFTNKRKFAREVFRQKVVNIEEILRGGGGGRGRRGDKNNRGGCGVGPEQK